MGWEIGAGIGACFGAFIVLVIISVVVSHRKERARQDALARWAMQADFRYVPRPDVDWGRRMPGRNKRGVTLALSGTVDGRPVTIAEYHYTTTSTSTDANGNASTTTHTHRFVLTMARLRRPAPTLVVHRRGAMSKVGRALFGDRDTAIGHPPFDSVYRVVADDPRFVRSTMTRALVGEHLAGHLPDWGVEGYDVLTFRQGRIGDPTTIMSQLAPVRRIADHLDTAVP